MRKVQVLGDREAAQVAVHAMLAANSYHRNDRIRFAIESIGWTQIDANGSPIPFESNRPTQMHPVSRLAYDIYQQSSTNSVIFAFRGTDDLVDFLAANFAVPPFNVQYRQAREAVDTYLSRNASKNLSVTGHSLGGGIALSVSVRLGVPAIAFDSSPRIFDGFGDHHKSAPRKCVYQAGEILEKVRNSWSKFWDVMDEENVFKCTYNFEGYKSHRCDILARYILKSAAHYDASLAALDGQTSEP